MLMVEVANMDCDGDDEMMVHSSQQVPLCLISIKWSRGEVTD